MKFILALLALAAVANCMPNRHHKHPTKIVAVGGNVGGGTFSTVEVYDVKKNTWTALNAVNDIPISGYAFMQHKIGAHVYACGGTITFRTNFHANCTVAPAHLIVKNSSNSNPWKPLPSLPVGLAYGGMAHLKGKLYVAARADVLTGKVYEFDLKTKKWSEFKYPLPYNMIEMLLFTVDDKLYAIDDSYGAGCNYWVPGSSKGWQNCSLQFMNAGQGAVVNEKVYVFGRYKMGADTFEFDPKKDTWTRKAYMLSGRYGPGVAVIGDDIYVCGGADPGLNAKCQKYDTKANKWSSIASMTTDRVHFQMFAI